MKINQPWKIDHYSMNGRCAHIAADDGATYEMDANRARRLVALWNAKLGVPMMKLRRAQQREGK